MAELVDLLIRNGLVLDGRNRVDAITDVAIDGGRIVGFGNGFRSRESIDATGCVVAPGFIDVHTHSDFTMPVRPAAEAKLRQGVTTDVTGNCGFSPFPLTDSGPIGLRHGAFMEPALSERWPNLSSYAAALNDARPGINVAPLLGLGAVRLAVIGEERRAATEHELETMLQIVSTAMHERAFGVSSGLVYAPSSYADVSELAQLAEVSGRAGGIYATHMRDEADAVTVAVEEAIEVGRRARCPVQISHHKALGRRNWGRVEATLALIDAENQRGGDVAFDVYPYTAGSTTLISLLPPAELSQGEPVLRQALAEPGYRARMLEAIRTTAQFRPEDVMLASVPSRPDLGGRMVVEAATAAGVEPAELILRLIESDGSGVVMIGFGVDEGDLRRLLKHPRSLIGSDGWVLEVSAQQAHPRNFACMPRLLARYVRDEQLIALPDAVAKLTSLAADRIGLVDRGVLAPGMAADVAVFALDRMTEGADYSDQREPPAGVMHVVVNGRLALEHGEPTGVRAGRVLARGRTE